MVFDERRGVSAATLELFGEPGKYYLRLYEPKRNVVFSWDTSASMGPYLAITYNVLASFAESVDPEKETVQLLAYAHPYPIWLMDRFTSDAEALQDAVNSFDRSTSSSNSKQPMIMAADAMADLPGTKALLLITDAETTGSNLSTQVWNALHEVPMQVFTFEVNSYGSLYSQQYMQDWAAANEGLYARNHDWRPRDGPLARIVHLRCPETLPGKRGECGGCHVG